MNQYYSDPNYLHVSPAGGLRLWQASRESDNVVTSDFEPGMQADKWGAAGSVADGVRSNVKLTGSALLQSPG
ncbi:MAG: hypothetical protein WAT12_15445 [Candidatus Nitrotoga sp.]